MFKRILRVLFSRTVLFVLLAALQVGVFLLVLESFAHVGTETYMALNVFAVLVLLVVLEKDDLNPTYKTWWILMIALLPLFGALLYLLWGHRHVPARVRSRMEATETRADEAMRQNPEVLAALHTDDVAMGQCAGYLLRCAAAPVYPAGDVKYYPLGHDFFPHFLESLRRAEKYIFMEYYIVEPGYMLDEIVSVLCEKAAQGVDVRFLWDGVGSLFTLPRSYERKMCEGGIQCRTFYPVHPTIHLSEYAMFNHRDHRKIAVVDGEVGFSGGLNIADEYINRKERFGLWKDTCVMLRGEPVYSLTTTFLRMWDFTSGACSPMEQFRPPVREAGACGLSRGYVQPFADTPLDGENVSESAYFNIIRTAHSYVYISTPYLILDNEMVTYLTLAAKSGLDVRILVPGIPDKIPVYWATQSYYRVLLEGGVRLYEYTPGFNHAKMYVSDDAMAIVGSANMDYRSLYLHFENCVAFYGGETPRQVKQDMLDCFAVSHEVSLDEVRSAGLWRRGRQVVAKLFAPML